MTHPHKTYSRSSVAGAVLAGIGTMLSVTLQAEPARRAVIPARGEVPPEVMTNIYEEVKTPYKYGVVLKAEGAQLADAPQIFRHGDKWYMMYITIRNGCPGYETMLAVSDDLLEWKTLGNILPFRKNAWDSTQAAGYFALQDPTWGGSYKLATHAGKYWLCYFGGTGEGYEPDPLSIGMAWTPDPTRPEPWTRLEAPVLSGAQPDSRYWEKQTLFQGYIIEDKAKSLAGYPYLMVYNARSGHDSYERMGLAVSKDMRNWVRYGRDPIIDHGRGLAGAGQVVRIGDVWVMFYFGAFWCPKICDTFACSYDLVHWTKWLGPTLVEGSEPWDKDTAHKPWMVKHNGVVYHFYCACGDKGRVVALATSKPLPRRQPVKAIPAGYVDQVKIDDDDAWTPRNVQSNTGIGPEGRFYRHALPGGWFSWKLDVKADQPNRLICTYWGGVDRAFDILVDDVKLATQIIGQDHAGKYFDVEYMIPAELTQGKKAVTVKFQPHPGKIAGGVFGCAVK